VPSVNFKELDDRYETELKVGNFDVSLSVDKPVSEQDLSRFKDIVTLHGVRILDESLGYIESKKSEYDLARATDLDDPQIIWGEEFVSVYWYSENGENVGASIIGVDFRQSDLSPIDVTIGD
jgi:hypothetical protein